MRKLNILFVLCIFCVGNISLAYEKNLVDIENHWAKENIVRMLTNDIVNGYPDNTFKPNNEVTTLEFIKIILETLDIELVERGFKKWPEHYIATAEKYNLSNNYDEKLTRYEATQIISKLIDIKNISTSSNKFKDLDSKYKNNVLKLSKLKIINGYEDNTFRGEKILTRAEAVTIALRALDANNEIVSNKKYKIDSKYTNVGLEDYGKSEIDMIRYEVKNGKIYFTDRGRFSYISNYSIDEKYVTNRKLIKIIETLVDENSYTAVYYVPSKYIINQVKIEYGEDDNLVNRGLPYFSFTYYEDKLYDLKRISLKDKFSNECYMKITLNKLWKDLYEFRNSKLVDENIKKKFLKALEIEFDNNAEKIMDYMVEKYINNMNNQYAGETIVEQEKIGNYIINFYKTDATSLEFYFEKLSS